MANLELIVLGGLSLRWNGLPVPDLKSQKGLALLCYLAVTRQAATRAALAGLFWPDMLEADAHMNLRKVLFRLKPLAAHLAISRGTLAFDPAVSYNLDAADFEAQAGRKTDIGSLENAAGLYRGDFLDGFYLDDAPLFDEWVLAQRARLRGLAMGVLTGLISHFAGRAEYETAIGYAQRVLALEPWHEEAHRELMRLLALSGQRSAALHQFETCRRLLASELAAAPAAATVHLYELIQSGATAELEAGGGQASVLLPPSPPHNLPVQTTRFVARQSELAALSAHLADPNLRLLTIVGYGGMGKTRLAVAAAEAAIKGRARPQRFPQGVVFVALARLEEPEQLVQAIAEAAHLNFLAGRDPKTQLLDYLRQKAILLLLDNFEHLRAQAVLVDEILRAAAKVKILVTSREKLNLEAEQLFPIGGLAVPPAAEGADTAITGFGAVQLFLERARRVRPDFVLSSDNQPAVTQICRLVQGMPLGIVLATAWLDVYPPQAIAGEMQKSLDFLEAEMVDLPARQRSLRAAFNYAWQLLPEVEQGVFQRLSVFRGGFTGAAAQAVTGATPRDLQGLANKSLLAATPDGRYELHELLRQFAAEKLAAAPEAEARVRDAHSAFYCDFLREHTPDWHDERQKQAPATVARESDNVRRAWQWAVEQGDCDRLLPALECWAEYLGWHGLDREAEATFRALAGRMRALASVELAASPANYHLWAMALAWQAYFNVHGPTAVQLLRESLDLIERLAPEDAENRRAKAFVLSSLGGTLYSLDRKAARPLLEAGLALYEAGGDRLGTALALNSLGHLDWATGHYARAQERGQAALAMFTAAGDLRGQLGPLETLSWIHNHAGRLDEVLRLRRQALDLSYQLNHRSALPGCMANYAFSLFWHGKFDEMRKWAHEALDICQELGQRGTRGYVQLAICMAHLGAGQYEAAQREGLLALAGTREAGAHGIEATVHWALGCLALINNDCQAAKAYFAESRRLYEEVEDNYIGLVLPAPGYVACRERQPAQARGHFLEALHAALALKDYLYLIMALPGVALYLSQMGEIVRALEIWELALGQPYIAKCRWHADVVGQPLEAAALDLPANERRAARERGRALDLWETAEALVADL